LNLGVDIIAVENPYDGEVIDELAGATEHEARAAVERAAAAAPSLAGLTTYERAILLEQAAERADREVEEFAKLIVAEQGKTITEARGEAGRVGPLLRLCAAEIKTMHEETLPLDASPNGAGRVGLRLRIPVGLVVAITPFNYPLLLVAHKLGPALAAGNAVILKPSSLTPLTARRFVALLHEAGYHDDVVQCLVGRGPVVVPWLCGDTRVRVVTFTGSRDAGAAIAHNAGVQRLCLELGANCPMVVMDDADIEAAAAATVVGGYANAGQACISAQRLLVHESVYGSFIDALTTKVSAIRPGDPTDPETTMGPLITEVEAQRVEGVIDAAVAAGARLISGGERDGSLYAPTVVADVPVNTSLFSDELFGPAVGVTRFTSFDEGVALANASVYGLGAAIYTRDVHRAFAFAQQAEAGNIHINSSPLWRVDAMPYGGLKQSGLGKEGPRYAIEEMTDTKTVVFHPVPQI
jgi:acyl-CoA reductase-like NAD-dependent aldehyde dehydrogenase